MKKITFLVFSLLLLFTLKISAQAPDNDTCSGAVTNAITLNVGNPGVCNNTQVTIDNATDSGFSDGDCDNDGSKDLWFILTVPSSGGVRIETSSSGSIEDTVLAVYTGSDCANLTSIDCNDDLADGISTFSRVTISETPGSTIYIRVWDFDGASSGNFNICATEINLADNDDCIDAITLSTNSTTCTATLGSNDATNSEDAEPSIPDPGCETYLGGDVWYSISVPDTGRFYVETSNDDGSVTDTGMAIYSGTCSGLSLIACDEDGGSGNFSRIELSDQTQGQTLFVRVWSYGNTEIGTFNICAAKLPTLSTKDIQFGSFAIFPNPAKDDITLKFDRMDHKNTAINIYDIQGKLVLQTSQVPQNNKLQLTVSSLKTGMYFVTVKNGLHSETKKLMIR